MGSHPVMTARNAPHTPRTPVPPSPTATELLRLYRQMVLIRRFEKTVQTMYRNSELPGFVHLYIGEEATAVGVMAHLRPDDWITSTHRGHGHALAKGVPPKVVLAELAGKATGCCGGRGGSMHLYAPAAGAVWHQRRRGRRHSRGRRLGHQRQGPRHRPGGRGLLRRRGQQPRGVSRGASISAASRTPRWCSSAKTISTPRPRP